MSKHDKHQLNIADIQQSILINNFNDSGHIYNDINHINDGDDNIDRKKVEEINNNGNSNVNKKSIDDITNNNCNDSLYDEQLTFVSNKTFPMDVHYHHNVSPPAIDTILDTVVLNCNTLFSESDQLIDDNNALQIPHLKLSTISPELSRPVTPSHTPPTYNHSHYSRSSFHSFKSMPNTRLTENNDVCIMSQNEVQSSTDLITAINNNSCNSKMNAENENDTLPPPYNRFESKTIPPLIIPNNHHLEDKVINFDYIDSDIGSNGDPSAFYDHHNLHQQSRSTTELNFTSNSPELTEIFSHKIFSGTYLTKKDIGPSTPTPYDRLVYFKQHNQHLSTRPSTSSLLRRLSLPSRSKMHASVNNQDQHPRSSQSFNMLLSKEKRIGHRRVNEEGQVTYKKIKSTQLMYSMQLGIGYSVGSLASKPERDLLMRDFMEIETVHFPKSGSQITPAHHYTDFIFSTYSPFAFRFFRDLFGIQPDDFMLSITNEPLQELSNPGASGSMFFRTKDDQFIIKTVEKNEAKFLLKLLPGYYMNLSQNRNTLLPKFFGLYCYECIGKNIRILVMNNLLPSHIKIHQKYDLKGSTHNRKANSDEMKKCSPTCKDLDFLEYYYNDENKTLITHFSKMAELTSGDSKTSFPIEGGLLLEASVYDKVVESLKRDCRVLQSFEIMDYSLLIGIHNYDWELKENGGIKAFDYDKNDELPARAIRAMNRKGERLLLFIGIIDILQSYRFVKKVEHAWKSLLYDGNAVSVTRPDLYSKRFLEFMCTKVFGRLSFDNNYYSRLD